MKLRVILIALLLFAPLTPSISATPPKAGATCSKAGIKKNYNDKKYTCIKRGKKLVWDKGVVIKTSQSDSTPAPTLSLSSNPASTPTPTPTPITTPTPSKNNDETINLDNLDVEKVNAFAYRSVIDSFRNSVDARLDIKLIADDSIQDSFLKLELERIQRIHRLLELHFSPTNLTAIYWINTSKEKSEWGQNAYNQLGSPIKRTFSEEAKQFPCGAASGFAWKSIKDNKSFDNWGYISCAGETTPDKAFKPIHEYFHLFQTKFNFTGPHMVSWLVEGSADFYGQILGLQYENQDLLNIHRRMMTNWVSEGKNLKEDEFVALMKRMETDEFNKSAYYLGSLATEVLVAIYGHEKFVNFIMDWKDLPDCRMGCNKVENNFSERFNKHFSIKPEAFYKKIYPYYREINSNLLK